MDCHIFYSLEVEARTLEEADRITKPICRLFENFCEALGLSYYIQRSPTYCVPVFYRFDVHFIYSKAAHKRFATALAIFADIHGLQFCNETLSIDGKECFSEQWHDA